MRRGLMGWSEADLPQTTLKLRLARLQEGLKSEGLGGAVIYTNHARPAAVSFDATGFAFPKPWAKTLLMETPESTR